jgi:hypothetical protein
MTGHGAAAWRHGLMVTDRPDRYAKQLFGHWSKKAAEAEVGDDGAIVMRFAEGQGVELRADETRLAITVTAPDVAAVDRFAEVVAVHLERFGQRDELHVVGLLTGSARAPVR